jgi:hypothetical protein
MKVWKLVAKALRFQVNPFLHQESHVRNQSRYLFYSILVNKYSGYRLNLQNTSLCIQMWQMMMLGSLRLKYVLTI